ncbi:MAG TPA: hypothetical protein VMB47_04430 [Candidatus Aquilonibacter sp.]|nr:hypothetical protein [Candidatus Aquilonibacter sp.]
MSSTARLAIAPMIVACLCVCALLRVVAQDDSNPPVNEVVVNQAAGRVVIAVVKHAILISTSENPIEEGTRPPIPTAMSSIRAGIFLGADEWTSPSLQRDLGLLDQELPQLRSAVGPEAPSLGVGVANAEATDIEGIGKPLGQRLGDLAGEIHSNLNWPETDPVAELVLADYVADYGPEVWTLTYTLEQEQQQGDYWVTNVDGPVYLQIWPPEKGQPHTLMEFDYPQKNAPTPLLDLLKQKDPRLEGLIQGDQTMADTANKFLIGDSMKISATDATQFLRAAMDAITPPNLPQTMAIIREDSGFDWILRPPPESRKINRPPGAPSLANPPSGDSDAPSLAHPPRAR